MENNKSSALTSCVEKLAAIIKQLQNFNAKATTPQLQGLEQAELLARLDSLDKMYDDFQEAPYVLVDVDGGKIEDDVDMEFIPLYLEVKARLTRQLICIRNQHGHNLQKVAQHLQQVPQQVEQQQQVAQPQQQQVAQHIAQTQQHFEQQQQIDQSQIEQQQIEKLQLQEEEHLTQPQMDYRQIDGLQQQGDELLQQQQQIDDLSQQQIDELQPQQQTVEQKQPEEYQQIPQQQKLQIEQKPETQQLLLHHQKLKQQQQLDQQQQPQPTLASYFSGSPGLAQVMPAQPFLLHTGYMSNAAKPQFEGAVESPKLKTGGVCWRRSPDPGRFYLPLFLPFYISLFQ